MAGTVTGTKITTALELVDNISGNLTRITKSVEGFTAGFSAAEAAVQNLNGAVIDIDSSGAVEAAGNVGKALESVSSSCGETSENANEFGNDCVKSINAIGSALKVMAIAGKVAEIAGTLLDAADGAAEFETAMTKISTITDTSAASMESMKEGIRNLSLETGESVNDISNSVYQALSAGVDSADAVSLTATATKLATGSFTEVSTAVDILSTALNAYGMSAGEAEGISDMLITTQNLSKTSVDQFANAISSVIPLAANYGVEMDNIASAYVGLTNSGIQASQAGTYIESMLTELGNSSSVAAQALREQTGASFESLMAQGYSLGDVLNELGTYVDGNTAKFNGLWSSQEAGAGAMALYNAGASEFNTTMAAMAESAGATESAYESVASTSENAKQSMVNAIENMSNSIGEDLNPALTSLYGAGEKFFTWLGNVIDSSPVFSAVLAGLAVTVTILATALTAFAVVTCPAVQSAVAALTATMAANQFFLIVTAVAAAVAGFITFCSVLGSTEDEVNQLTATSRRQYYELQDLNDQYDEACEKYGENSTKAESLKYQIDDLTESYNANKKTMEELVTECDELHDRHNELMTGYSESMSEIDNNATAALALVQQLEDLSDATGDAAGSSAEMEAIINKINEAVPGLSVGYSDAVADIDAYTESVKAAIQAQTRQQKAEELNKQWGEFQYNSSIIDAKIKELKEEQASFQDEINKLNNYGNSSVSENDQPKLTNAIDGYNEIQEQIDKLQADYDKEQSKIEAIEKEYEYMDIARQQAYASAVTAEDAEAIAIGEMSEALSDLKTKYDEAYNAAYNSISGQVGLFDEVSTECDLSVSQMIDAMNKQADYINNYKDNLKEAEKYGLDAGLIEALSDGSQESAAYLSQIITELKNAGDEAGSTVDQINQAFEGKESAMSGWAETVASSNEEVKQAAETALSGMYEVINSTELDENMRAQAMESVKEYAAGLSSEEAVEAVNSNAITLAEEAKKAVDEAAKQTVTATMGPFQDMNLFETGAHAIEELNNGMASKTEDVKTTAGTVADTVTGTVEEAMKIESPSKVMYGIGEYVVQGMIDGMNSMHGALVEAAIKMAKTIKEKVNNEMEIESPSKVMYEIGEYIVQGTANGINDNIDESRRAALNLSDSLDISGSVMNTLKGYSSEKDSGSSGDVTIKIDMSNMKNEIKSDDDIDSFINKLENKLTERFYVMSEGVHA